MFEQSTFFNNAQQQNNNSGFNFNQPQGQQIFQPQGKQYSEKLYRKCGFSFPSNHLFLVSLMQVVTDNPDYKKDMFYAFIACVMGVGNNNSRSFDFSKKIVQKFTMKDLASLSFTLKRLALADTSVLPYTKFTNSGSGPKSLYLQYKPADNNSNNKTDNVIIGSSHADLKINIVYSKADVAGIAQVMDQMIDRGIKLDIDYQIKLNDMEHGINTSDTYTPNTQFGVSNGGVSNVANNAPVMAATTQTINNSVPTETPMANNQVSQSAQQQINSFGQQYMNMASNTSRR